MDDFNTGRTALMFNIRIKYGGWSVPPFIAFALGHHDEDRARARLREAKGLANLVNKLLLQLPLFTLGLPTGSLVCPGLHVLGRWCKRFKSSRLEVQSNQDVVIIEHRAPSRHTSFQTHIT